jgi:hypothetical protein
MSFKYFPIKSVLLEGNINIIPEKKIVYKLCPGTEFSEGLWNLTVVSLSYNCQSVNEVKDVFSLTCNFVKGQKFSDENEIENYEMPLITFLLESVPNKSTKKNISFDKTWFHINALSNQLVFTVHNKSNPLFAYQSEFLLQVLFQRLF